MPNLAVAMIVKNEEQFIEKVIQNVQPVADEIVITDTGSTDKTLDIIKKFKLRLFHYKWNQDEAKARNFTISKCRADWILFIDADEFIETKDYPRVRKIISAKNKYIAYRILLKHYTDPEIKFENLYQKNNAGSYVLNSIIRLFKNGEGIFFSRPTYVSVNESLRNRQDKVGNTNIVFHHLDILRNKQKRIEKTKWYSHDVFKNLKSFPDNAEVNYAAAHYYKLHGNFARAIKYYKNALRIKPEYAKARLSLGLSYVMSGREKEGLRIIKTCQKNKRVFGWETEAYLNSAYMVVASRMAQKKR